MKELLNIMDDKIIIAQGELARLLNGDASPFKIHNQKHYIRGLKEARDTIKDEIIKGVE